MQSFLTTSARRPDRATQETPPLCSKVGGDPLNLCMQGTRPFRYEPITGETKASREFVAVAKLLDRSRSALGSRTPDLVLFPARRAASIPGVDRAL